MTATATKSTQQGFFAVFVFGIGVLLSVSVHVSYYFSFNLNMSAYVPIVAAWLSWKYGWRSLLAWWPFLLIPYVDFEFGQLRVEFYFALEDLLLAMSIGILCDRRHVDPFLSGFVRPNGRWVAVLSVGLLMMAAIDRGEVKPTDQQMELLVLFAVLLFFGVLRWKDLINALQVRSAVLVWTAVLASAVAQLSSLAVEGAFVFHNIGLSFGSVEWLVPILCFMLVAVGGYRILSIVLLLVCSLVIDRILALVFPENSEFGFPLCDWKALNWDVILGGFAFACTAKLLKSWFGDKSLSLAHIQGSVFPLLALLMVAQMGCHFLPEHAQANAYASYYGLVSTLAFVAGVRWCHAALTFATPFLQLLWLFFAMTIPPEADAREIVSVLIRIAVISFPFAFVGALFRKYVEQGQGDRPISMAEEFQSGGAPKVVDESDLIEVIARIDRAATLRSFFVVASPFLVTWQMVTILMAYYQFEEVSRQFGFGFFAFALLVAVVPFAFVLLDWLNRRDSSRVLAAISGSVAGCVCWIAITAFLWKVLGDYTVDFVRAGILYSGILVFWLMFVWTGLYGRYSKSSYVAFAQVGLALTAIFVLLASYWTRYHATESYDVFESVVEAILLLAVCGSIAIFLARFVGLRLILAGGQPRDLVFGELHNKGFWPRMAAAAGLPSSMWRAAALRQAGFWVLLAAHFITYAGIGIVAKAAILPGALILIGGHAAFALGKWLSSREIWRPHATVSPDRPTLFLRGFDDDQCNFHRPAWNLLARWLDLWSFRRNLDEAMIDEVAQFGPVVALGRPGDKRIPFGALRHYAKHEDWQATLEAAAHAAQVIVLVASDSPGVEWEYDFLARERMHNKLLLMFRPDIAYMACNRSAAEWFCRDAGAMIDAVIAAGRRPVAMRMSDEGVVLLTSSDAGAAAYVLALRLHFLVHGKKGGAAVDNKDRFDAYWQRQMDTQ